MLFINVGGRRLKLVRLPCVGLQEMHTAFCRVTPTNSFPSTVKGVTLLHSAHWSWWTRWILCIPKRAHHHCWAALCSWKSLWSWCVHIRFSGSEVCWVWKLLRPTNPSSSFSNPLQNTIRQFSLSTTILADLESCEALMCSHSSELHDSFYSSSFNYSCGLISITTLTLPTETFHLFDLLERDKKRPLQWDGWWIIVLDGSHHVNVLRPLHETTGLPVSWMSDQPRARYICRKDYRLFWSAKLLC